MTHSSGEAQSRGWDEEQEPTTSVDRRHRLARPAWLARATTVALCVVSLAFAALLVAGLMSGQLAVVVKPLPLRVGLALPPVVAVLAIGTVAGTVLAWYNGYWSRAARIHQSVLAVLGLVFLWQLVALGFLP